MKIKLLLLGLFLGILPGWSQVVENDSIVCLSLDELRVITKMTEDLKYTKAELEMADSVIYHQREIIDLKDDMINLKTQELQDNIKKSKKKQIKTGVMSGIIGIILGAILGGLYL